MPRNVILLLIGLTSLAGGCAAPMMARHEPGRELEMRTTRHHADYVLYEVKPRRHDPPRVEITSRPVHRGHRIGFVRGAGGQLYAVAGAEQIELDEGPYHWQARPGTMNRPQGDVARGFGYGFGGSLLTWTLILLLL